MDVYDTRHRNLLWLMHANKAAGGKDKDFGQRVGGIGGSFLSQLKAGKKMGDDVARGIDAALGKPSGWMDSPQWDGAEPPTVDAQDNLAAVVEALSWSQMFFAQALAATIPSAAQEVKSALDNTLPPELREIGYIKTLRQAIVRQLGRNDMASLRTSSQKVSAKPQRKRR